MAASPENVASPNSAFPKNVAAWNQASPENVALAAIQFPFR